MLLLELEVVGSNYGCMHARSILYLNHLVIYQEVA